MRRLKALPLIVLILIVGLLSGCLFKPVSLEISTNSPLPLRQGDSITLTAIGIDSTNKERPVSVTWSVTPSNAGTFSKSSGSSTVFTVTLNEVMDIVIKGTADVLEDTLSTEIYIPVLASITVSPSSWTMADGESKVFTATGIDQHDRSMAVSPDWSVTGGIGTVHPTSGITTTFTASEVGSGSVIATQGAKSNHADITVNPAPSVLTTLVVSPSSAELLVGESQEFTAEGFNQYGQPMDINPSWSVTGGIGSINPTSGDNTTFTAEATGAGTVTASVGAISDYANVTVTNTITFSGIVTDNKTEIPLGSIPMKIYESNGTLVADITTNPDGTYTSPKILKKEGVDSYVIKTGDYPNHFVRRIVTSNESKTDLDIKIVENTSEGLGEFLWEVSAGGDLGRVEPPEVGNIEIIILTNNPVKNGTFTQEQASEIKSGLEEPATYMENLLSTANYSISIDPSGEYSPGPGKYYYLSNAELPPGRSIFKAISSGTVTKGGIIEMNIPNASPDLIKAVARHEIWHSMYFDIPRYSFPSLMDPAINYFYPQPLDLEGTYIANEPTYLREDFPENPVDSLQNILGTTLDF